VQLRLLLVRDSGSTTCFHKCLQGSRGRNVLYKIDAAPGRGCDHNTEIYNQMQWPNGAEPLIKRVHEALNMDKSLVWKQLANKFEAVNAVSMESEEEVDNEVDAMIGELEHLLSV
jgi:hypothetical protein